MELTSDTDSDDCQLYTKTVVNIGLEKKKLQAKLQEFEQVINLASEENVVKEVSTTNDSIQPYEMPDTSHISDIDEEEIPLSELSSNLRRSKRTVKSKSNSVQNRKRKGSKRRGRPMPTTSNLDTVVLDDDSGFPTTLSPIDFNSRSKKRRAVLDDSFTNISLSNDLNASLDSDEEFYANDTLVTLTVEWNNNKNITRKEFKLHHYQKFGMVFEELAKLEQISTNHVLLMHNFNSVTPMDTPSGLNMKFYGALTGSISTDEINRNNINLSSYRSNQVEEHEKGLITVKLQLESRQSFCCSISKHQKLVMLYKRCSEEFNCEQSKLKITFDGECVDPDDLVSDLDIEDGDVFHVYVKS